MQARSAIVAQLREHLARVAPPRAVAPRLSSGLPELDLALQGGWPQPGIALVRGAPGSGRFAAVLPAMRALTRAGRFVALVDSQGWLNPPGLEGVVLERLLVVRPGAGRAGWAAEQLARSGEIPLVLVLDPDPLGRAGRRLLHACEAGASALLVLQEGLDPHLPSSVVVEVQGHVGEGVALSVPRGPRGPRRVLVAA